VLLLLNIQLDKVCILLDLVLCDAHCQQLLQQGLPRGVRGVDGGAPCAWRAGVAALRGRHHVHARRRHHGLRRRRCVGRMPVAEQAPQEAMAVALPIRGRPAGPCGGAEGLVLCVLVGVLLAVVDLLLECLGLLLVGEGEGGQAVLELEGVEEDAVLVVGEVVVDLLVPDDATVGRLQHAMSGLGLQETSAHTYRDVDQLEPEGITDQVVCQHGRALQACVRPVGPVRVGNVQLGDGDGVDLVGRLGDGALDRQLVLVRQDRGHGGGAGALTMSRGVGVRGSRCRRVSSSAGRWSAWAWVWVWVLQMPVRSTLYALGMLYAPAQAAHT
jgi:hypothetical protein